MRIVVPLIAALTLCIAALPAAAATRTVELSVPGMYCSACPYIVEKTVAGVSGVQKVTATLKGRTATVTYDDGKTNVGRVLAALAKVGYPATVSATPQRTGTQP